MNMIKTILPLVVLASAMSLGCASPDVDDDAPEGVASVAQATVYAPVMGMGETHTCATKSDGSLYCWGDNTAGMIGDGTATTRTSPVLVSGVSDVVSIGAGYQHTCVATATGAVYCWGANNYGKLGDGTTIAHNTPALVTTSTGLGNVVSVSSGYNHTCALQAGAVYCWGSNIHGELGDGTTTSSSTPVAVNFGARFAVPVAIGVGSNHSCAVLSSGAAVCWGQNTTGELGDGLTASSSLPVDVVGVTSRAIAITSGLRHSCALLSTGRARCWGDGLDGQLGDGGTASGPVTAVTVSGLTTIESLEAGRLYTCATLSDGTGRCWGYDGYRNLGDGATTQQNSPVTVGVLADGVSVSAGWGTSCALRSGGGVKCWGLNNLGNLGIGTTTVTTTVVDVLGLP